jgi:spore coat polysaccharide biosynthesis protein SpsF
VNIDYRVFVQARMSSRRLPGKMLAPLAGRPLIAHVAARLRDANLLARSVLVTSTDPTDDPLADYAANRLGMAVFRGALDDVLARFQAALRAHPADWIVRISGDSPLIDGALVRRMVDFATPDIDVVSNVVRRTFPPGQSVECIRAAVLNGIESVSLTTAQREHVMPYFYQPGVCRVRSIVSGNDDLAARRLVVDTLDDLANMDRLVVQGSADNMSFAQWARVETP